MVPKDLIHIAQRLDLQNQCVHPPDHALLIHSTSLRGIARRRQLRWPDALVRPCVVQRRLRLAKGRESEYEKMRGNERMGFKA